MESRELFDRYAPAVAYVAVQKASGDRAIGSAFHVGNGVFITARHVVEASTILEVGTTVGRYVPDPQGLVHFHDRDGTFRSIPPGTGVLRSGPFFHSDPAVDVAAFVLDGLEPPVVPLGSHLDDWLEDEAFVLAPVVVLGYPPIPFSRRPVLVTARAEVNAVIDPYSGQHPLFVVSAMARGGFSGGLCVVGWDFALGVITESLVRDNEPTGLGFMAVLTIEPIFTCLAHHGVLPDEQKGGWDGFWDRRASPAPTPGDEEPF